MGRRKVMLLVFALLLAVMIGFWLAAPKEKLVLNLVFLGYTNETFPTQTPAGLKMVVYSPLALVQASNSGNRPVEVMNALRSENLRARDFARPLPYGFPSVLNPGESTVLRVRGDGWRIEMGEPNHVPWRTEIVYRRSGARERVLAHVWKIAGTTGQRWLSQVGIWPNPHWATCGPITNALPHVPRLASLTNHFLDLPDPELRPQSVRPFDIHQILTNFPQAPALRYDVLKK